MPLGNRSYLYTFFFIGIFILILACVNYVNMATARSSTRVREIGMKKVLGPGKKDLIFQLSGESLPVSFLAMLFANGAVLLSLTPLNQRLELNLETKMLFDPVLIAAVLGLFLLIGILSGIYPAFYLSAIRSVTAISGGWNSGRIGGHLRRILVAFQFVISLGVVIITLFMNRQVEFMRSPELPPQACISLKAGDGMEDHNFWVLWAGFDFVQTLGAEIVEGRSFDPSFSTDRQKDIIVNETLVRFMEWDNPIGKRVTQGTHTDGRVIGVVKDFHFASLHNKIEPMLIRMIRDPEDNMPGSVPNQIMVRLKGQSLTDTLESLEESWSRFNPNRPFIFSFLDESFDRLCDADRRQNRLVKIFSGSQFFPGFF